MLTWFCLASVLLGTLNVIVAGLPIAEQDPVSTMESLDSNSLTAPAPSFPQWAILVIVLVIVHLFLVIGIYLYCKRHRKSKASDNSSKMKDRSSFASSVRAAMSSRMSFAKEKTSQPESPSSIDTSLTLSAVQERKSLSQPREEFEISHFDENEKQESNISQVDHFRISLPMPPPSTSLFSDKMELTSDEAREMFAFYMVPQTDKETAVSESNEKSTFYSAAAANIQQKAATIRSTFRQSLRRQKSTKGANATSIMDIFQKPPTKESRPSLHDEMIPAQPAQPDRTRLTRKPSIPSRLPRPSSTRTPSPPPSLTHKIEVSNIPPRPSEETKYGGRTLELDLFPGNITLSSPSRAFVSSTKEEVTYHAVDVPADINEVKQAERSRLFEDDADKNASAPSANHAFVSHTVGRFSGAHYANTSTDRTSEASINPFADIPDTKTRANTLGKSSTFLRNSGLDRQSPSVRTVFSSTCDSQKSQLPSPEEPGNLWLADRRFSIESSTSQRSQVSVTVEKPPLSPSVDCTAPVDSIRRALQSSWSSEIKENDSTANLSVSSVTSGSLRQSISPPGSVNPRQLNQHLVSLSLKARHIQRPGMPVGFTGKLCSPGDEHGLFGPEPTASFSSSTVQTMIPENEADDVPIVSGQRERQPETIAEEKQAKLASNNKPNGTFGTVRSGRRQQGRASAPWNEQSKSQGKTPAQRERDRYLQSLKGS